MPVFTVYIYICACVCMGVGGRNEFQDRKGNILIGKNFNLRSQVQKNPFMRNISLTLKYGSFKSNKKGCKPLNQFQPWIKSTFSIKLKNLSLALDITFSYFTQC